MKKKVSGKTLIILAIILIVLLCMIGTRTANSGNTSAPKNVVMTVLTPVQSGFTRISKSFGGFFGHFTDITVLRDENEKLTKQVDDLTTAIGNPVDRLMIIDKAKHLYPF